MALLDEQSGLLDALVHRLARWRLTIERLRFEKVVRGGIEHQPRRDEVVAE